MLAQVLRAHWPSYRARFHDKIPAVQRAAVRALVRCRTPALGGGRYRCACGQDHFAYHSCGHRACPQCGHADALLWLEKQRTRLLPVPYFLVTFTVPEQLRAIIRSHQKIFYHLLFTHSSGALLDVALSKLGLQLGLLGVLHTWTRQLHFHPHVHFVVPGGGLSPDGRRWQRVQDPQFLLSTRVLAARFRNRLRQHLEREHNALLRAIPAAAWRQRWVVDVQPVGSGQSALKYLAAYVYRTALGRQRIVRDQDGQVTFTYRQAGDGRTKLCTASAHEFLRRFLQHVLPRGFQRVRYYGWLSPVAKGRWQRIQTLLDWQPAPLPPPSPRPPWLCPQCGEPMTLVGQLARAPPRHP